MDVVDTKKRGTSTVVEQPVLTADQPKVTEMMPLVVNMGKIKRSKAKKIGGGKGLLLDHVERAIQYTKENLGDGQEDKVIVPVVLVYEKKPKKKRNRPFGWL